MYKETYLSYINAKNNFFQFTDFNFDFQYDFHVKIDKGQPQYKYILYVSKKKKILQPKGFWGKNISAMHVITGQNGAGKTSILRFIINNIGQAINAWEGEGVIYIVNHCGTYIVFHNCKEFVIVKDSDVKDINIIQKEDYFNALRISGDHALPFNNRLFWQHIIFFSNYFGSTSMLKEDDYVINVSKDKEICEMLNGMDDLSELPKITIQQVYQNYQNTKIISFLKQGLFEEDELNEIISIPNLIHFKLLDIKDIDNLYKSKKEKFPNGKWIGKNRYAQFSSGLRLEKEREFEFEAAINKFAVNLMYHLLEEETINQRDFDLFLDELAETDCETGIEIAQKKLLTLDYTENKKWINILNFLAIDNKTYVIYWQSSDEFIYKWTIEDIEVIESLISTEAATFFTCDLGGINGKGYYSSGQESKMRFLISLYDALDKMKEVEKSGQNFNQNILLVLDELDAYFHPKYQIDLVDNILKIVTKILKDYSVQIILTSNTPLELSDFPASNIIYLREGEIIDENNEIDSFGSNVSSLLKNNFYIDSTMGKFAKKKIDQAIAFLLHNNYASISKEEVQYIIAIIGEPLIKNKLQELYYKKYPEEIPNRDDEIALYKRQLFELQQKIKNGKQIDDRALNQLEEELDNLIRIVKEIRG